MRGAEPCAANVRHWIDFTEAHVIQDPVTEILKDRSNTIDIVIGAYDPQRSVVLENPSAG